MDVDVVSTAVVVTVLVGLMAVAAIDLGLMMLYLWYL